MRINLRGFIVLSTFLFVTNTFAFKSYKAIVAVPVADILSVPFKNNIRPQYDSIAPDYYERISDCPRIHQAIFNEIIDVLGKSNGQVRIATPNVFLFARGKKYAASGWTLEENIVPLKSIDTKKLPNQIRYKKGNISRKKNEIVLALPFFDEIHNQLLSAGTRLIFDTKKSTPESFAAYILNPNSLDFDIVMIPKTSCIHKVPSSNKTRTQKFIQLLRRWSDLDPPTEYVWGGASIGSTRKYKNYLQRSLPQRGIDCSSLIFRAAQAYDIPLFCKNSTTLKKRLKKITKRTGIRDGDLFYINGHIMVLADKKNGTIIEARTEKHGYDRLHEMPLQEQFPAIKTYRDLEKALFRKKRLVRLDKNQKVINTYKNFQILQLRSCYR